MKIIILGAGRVGYSVAESLVGERNDITVIDTNAERLHDLQERFDLRGVVGSGLDLQVLAEAGAADTDLLLACAAQDETNLVCCKLAHDIFCIPTRIARVRTAGFQDHPGLLGPHGFAVDAIICPEASLTRYITQLITYPGALQVHTFAGGRACLASVRARAGAPAVGGTIAALRAQHPGLALRIVAIYRRFADEPDRFLRCNGNVRIAPGDEVFVLAASEHLQAVLDTLQRAPTTAAILAPDGPPSHASSGISSEDSDNTPPALRTVRRIMVAGGGGITLRLVQALAQQPVARHIKILESDPAQCQALAAALPPGTLILHGHATDEALLEEEGVETTDLFLALTDDDENNIMACLQAKRLGASRVLALINRRSYAELMHGTQIDIALSPTQPLLGELLTHIRKGDVQAVHSLRRGVAEALEIVARGDAKTSRVIGRKVSELRLPPEVHMGLIVRGLPEHSSPTTPAPTTEPAPHPASTASPIASSSLLRWLRPRQRPTTGIPHHTPPAQPQVIIPDSDTVIESNDHIVLFLPHKRLVRQVEEVFRIGATFF